MGVIMINLLDKVQTKWSTRNKNYYINKGYQFTAFGDDLSIYIKDLPDNSSIKVPVKCDYENCTSHNLWTPYRNYNRIIKENGQYLCKSCTIKQNHNNFLNIDRIEKWPKLYQFFLDKCEQNNCIPITTFDFYVQEYNCLIEFQGKQHYVPIKNWGGQEKLEYIQKHDSIKYNYAISHGIDILIINYLDQNHIEQILINKFNLE